MLRHSKMCRVVSIFISYFAPAFCMRVASDVILPSSPSIDVTQKMTAETKKDVDTSTGAAWTSLDNHASSEEVHTDTHANVATWEQCAPAIFFKILHPDDVDFSSHFVTSRVGALQHLIDSGKLDEDALRSFHLDTPKQFHDQLMARKSHWRFKTNFTKIPNLKIRYKIVKFLQNVALKFDFVLGTNLELKTPSVIVCPASRRNSTIKRRRAICVDRILCSFF